MKSVKPRTAWASRQYNAAGAMSKRIPSAETFEQHPCLDPDTRLLHKGKGAETKAALHRAWADRELENPPWPAG